jgi:branched-subunit amino acid transport protein
VFVPAERLPRPVTAALGHAAPAVLSALVSVEVVGLTGHGSPAARVASVGCVIAIAAVAYRRPSSAVTAGLGIAAVLLIDLVLAR